jgi:two-component system cell cycle response regulator
MTAMEHTYTVAVIGFNATERIMLGSIFNLSMRRNPSYRQAESSQHSDLLLVDGANPNFVDEALNSIARQPAAVLLIAGGDLETGWHAIARPLHWARLFKAMDLTLGFLTHGLAAHQPGARPAPPRYDMPAELTGIKPRGPAGRGPAGSGSASGPAGAGTPRTSGSAASASAPRRTAPAAASGSRTRVLYASAGAVSTDAVAKAIASTGAQVDVAQQGERVLEMIGQQRYGCVFVDAALPGIDGLQLCRLIKADEQGGAPVVLMKAKASAFERVRGSMAGCDAFVSLPATDEELKAVTTRLMPRRARAVSAVVVPHG